MASQDKFIRLRKITDYTCPTCGADNTLIEIRERHCSGEYNEYARYRCGCILHYSPTFQRVKTAVRCPKHPISRIVDAVDKDLKHRLMISIRMTIRETSLPAEDGHLLHELQEALKHISNDLNDQVHLVIKRHLY